jgi:hypothetical protein
MSSPYDLKDLSGSFTLTSKGAVQGFSQQDPFQGSRLMSGIFTGATATQVAWGGLPVKTEVPLSPLGSVTKLATTHATILAWSTFDGADHLILNQQSIGLYRDGMTMNYYEKGSSVCIWVMCDDSFAATLATAGSLTNTAASWDFTNSRLIAYDSTNTLPVTIERVSLATAGATNRLVSYNASTLNAQWSGTGCADTNAPLADDTSLALIRI